MECDKLVAFLNSIGIIGLIVFAVQQWLSIKKLEREIRFKAMYDQISRNLIELFPKLTKLKREVKKLINSEHAIEPSTDKCIQSVNESYDDAYNFVHEHRLLIPLPIFVGVNSYLKELREIRSKLKSGFLKELRGKMTDGHEDHWRSADDDLRRWKQSTKAFTKQCRSFLECKRVPIRRLAIAISLDQNAAFASPEAPGARGRASRCAFPGGAWERDSIRVGATAPRCAR